MKYSILAVSATVLSAAIVSAAPTPQPINIIHSSSNGNRKGTGHVNIMFKGKKVSLDNDGVHVPKGMQVHDDAKPGKKEKVIFDSENTRQDSSTSAPLEKRFTIENNENGDGNINVEFNGDVHDNADDMYIKNTNGDGGDVNLRFQGDVFEGASPSTTPPPPPADDNAGGGGGTTYSTYKQKRSPLTIDNVNDGSGRINGQFNGAVIDQEDRMHVNNINRGSGNINNQMNGAVIDGNEPLPEGIELGPKKGHTFRQAGDANKFVNKRSPLTIDSTNEGSGRVNNQFNGAVIDQNNNMHLSSNNRGSGNINNQFNGAVVDGNEPLPEGIELAPKKGHTFRQAGSENKLVTKRSPLTIDSINDGSGRINNQFNGAVVDQNDNMHLNSNNRGSGNINNQFNGAVIDGNEPLPEGIQLGPEKGRTFHQGNGANRFVNRKLKKRLTIDNQNSGSGNINGQFNGAVVDQNDRMAINSHNQGSGRINNQFNGAVIDGSGDVQTGGGDTGAAPESIPVQYEGSNTYTVKAKI